MIAALTERVKSKPQRTDIRQKKPAVGSKFTG